MRSKINTTCNKNDSICDLVAGTLRQFAIREPVSKLMSFFCRDAISLKHAPHICATESLTLRRFPVQQ
jgi:hypothetical protein